MNPTDDTLRTGGQAREDVGIARIEAGLGPGETADMKTMADVERVGQRLSNPRALGIFRVRREVVEANDWQGVAALLRLLGEKGARQVMFAFDGWADDPRELWEIPEAQRFCTHLLLGADPSTPDLPQARAVLGILVDEWAAMDRQGTDAFKMPGGLWLVSVVYHQHVFRMEEGGIMRDVSQTYAIYCGLKDLG